MIQLMNTLGQKLKYRTIEFSDGTRNVVIDMESYNSLTKTEIVTMSIPSYMSNEAILFEILMLDDALLALSPRKFHKLDILFNYLPHARADRRFEEGASFPLEVFFRVLCNSMKHTIGTIYIVDAHNQKAVNDIIYKVCPSSQKPQIQPISSKSSIGHFIKKDSVVVFPDTGAADRYGKFFLTYGTATKERDPKTGKIERIDVPDSTKQMVSGKVAVILDDICDGGGTFIPLAEILKKHAAEVHLVVTHGIFAKGLKPFERIVDKIYCGNHVGPYVSPSDIIRFNESGYGVEVKK